MAHSWKDVSCDAGNKGILWAFCILTLCNSDLMPEREGERDFINWETARSSNYGSHMVVCLLTFHNNKRNTGCSNNTFADFVMSSFLTVNFVKFCRLEQNLADLFCARQ